MFFFKDILQILYFMHLQRDNMAKVYFNENVL